MLRLPKGNRNIKVRLFAILRALPYVGLRGAATILNAKKIEYVDKATSFQVRTRTIECSAYCLKHLLNPFHVQNLKK